jgi:hypothetical protein
LIDPQADERFDLVLTPGNDVARVTDRAAQEQALRLAVVAYFDSIIGEIDRPTVLKKLEVQAQRAAAALGFVGQLAAITVAFSENDADAAVVELIYTTGETAEFTVG